VGAGSTIVDRPRLPLEDRAAKVVFVPAGGYSIYWEGADKVAPTILSKAAANNVVRPDLLTADGKGIEVLSASWVPSKWRPAVAQMIDQKDLKRIVVRSGLPGRTTKTIQYLVKGNSSVTVKYDSLKGGTVQKTIALQ